MFISVVYVTFMFENQTQASFMQLICGWYSYNNDLSHFVVTETLLLSLYNISCKWI